MNEVDMKRQANPLLSLSGEQALVQYEQALREQEDLTPVSIRNYLSDLRHFMAWYEACVPEHTTDTQVRFLAKYRGGCMKNEKHLLSRSRCEYPLSLLTRLLS